MTRLYVLVRRDLTKSQQAVQGGHALSEYLLRGPKTSWDNGTLIYLGVKNEQELLDICDKMSYNGINWVGFREPDRKNEMTAVCTENTSNIFSEMRLL